MTIDELADKIEPIPRFDDNELPTDFSSVKSYLKCPFMYKLQNIYGYNAAVLELFDLDKLHIQYWKDCTRNIRIEFRQRKKSLIWLKIHLCLSTYFQVMIR